MPDAKHLSGMNFSVRWQKAGVTFRRLCIKPGHEGQRPKQEVRVGHPSFHHLPCIQQQEPTACHL
ncbi:hypothetical protein [Myxococcus xanthus]|uniref:Uncharacterized protein n=1 Tax=Myxococcus xanthus TaxID=34 RepID=A0A7Y4IF88_MYXXA|nr:hypothetical protein [Myxococcus xanthus]NOJ78166.1 hypothetical protein [Myxococcus xanthus]NOJ85165.1 hypothetical protein [Myxococcus xanthus]